MSDFERYLRVACQIWLLWVLVGIGITMVGIVNWPESYGKIAARMVLAYESAINAPANGG